MASLSVLLPTLNCISLLPGHIASLRPWINLADEIIVVDSFSNDGTVEYLQRELAGLPVQFHSRPRGLYQSWNYGIQQVTKKWLYVSTVGDSMSRVLLTHLLAIGEAERSDIVMSRPQYIDGNDQPVTGHFWAIDDIIETAYPMEACTLSGAAAHYFSMLHTRASALLGSSASNLYRTAHLQKFPLPTEYGVAGDDAWSLMHAFETRFTCTAKKGSTFRFHSKVYSPSEYHVDQLPDRLIALGLERNQHEQNRGEISSLRIPEFLALRDAKPVLCAELKQMRKASRFWVIHPRIWIARLKYKQAQKRYKEILRANLAIIKRDHLKPVITDNSTESERSA